MRNIVLVLLLFLSNPLTGQELFRPVRAEQLELGTSSEEMVRVVGARVAYVDYDLIRETEEFAELKHASNDEIDKYILDHFSYMSAEQLQLNEVRHTEIKVDRNDRKIAQRPPGYFRAGILDMKVDMKGSGQPKLNDANVQAQVEVFKRGHPEEIAALRAEGYNSGVSTLGEAIAEVTRELAVRRSLMIKQAQQPPQAGDFVKRTVACYFVIDWGFDLIMDDGSHVPAGAVGRQPHFGREHLLQEVPDVFIDPYGGRQGSIMKSYVDFGSVLVTEQHLAALNFAVDQADPKNPQISNPWKWAHDTARAFRRGDKDAVYRHVLREMLQPLDSDWEKWKGRAPRDDKLKDQAAIYRKIALRNGSRDELRDLILQQIETPSGELPIKELIIQSLDYDLAKALVAKLEKGNSAVLQRLINTDLPFAYSAMLRALAQSNLPEVKSYAWEMLERITTYKSSPTAKAVPAEVFKRWLRDDTNIQATIHQGLAEKDPNLRQAAMETSAKILFVDERIFESFISHLESESLPKAKDGVAWLLVKLLAVAPKPLCLRFAERIQSLDLPKMVKKRIISELQLRIANACVALGTLID